MPIGRRTLGIAVALLTIVASCGDDTNDPDTEGGRAAFAYEMAVRNVLSDEIQRNLPTTVVTVPATDPSTSAVPTTIEVDKPVVYVVAADGTAIDPEVQVKVVKQLDDDEVDLRFADDRAEAIDADEPGEPVREDGVLIAAGSVPKEGTSIEFRFERYRSLDDRDQVVMSLERADETWSVTSTTVVAVEQ